MKGTAQDATVLRWDDSVSAGEGGGPGRAPGEATAPRVLKQRFVLEEKLGSGGMGTVFRAKDLRKVEARDRHPFLAIKVLNNDFREHPEAFIALQREAAKSQALSHRNIVSIYDFDKDGDVPFIIMELLEGQELAALLRAYPTGLPDDTAWSIIRCLCDGLEHAHEAGLVHADFKPGNVLVAPDHSAKILDFGIARAVQINQAQGEDTVFDPTRLAALTPAYASREMLEGADAEIQDDLYSLGVVIYLMLTGQHPYGRTPADEAARLGLTAERPRRLSRRQWRVLERCLAFDRSARPASVAELRKHLFEPSPWRSRTVLVALAAVLVTFAASALKEGAAVQEAVQVAQVETRQDTLMDAQIARVQALLQAPVIDAEWEAKVAEEVAILRSLERFESAGKGVLAAVRQRYREEILAADDPGRAVDLYLRALDHGPMPEAAAHLTRLLSEGVTALLDEPLLEVAWMDALDQALERYQRVFPGSPGLAALRLETVDVLTGELDASLAAERFPAARRALAYLETYGFDLDTLDALRKRVDGAERAFAAREAARRRQEGLVAFRSELETALGGACLRFDPSTAADVVERWVRRYRDFAAEGNARVAERVSHCLSQLEAVDRERAVLLRQRTVTLFGPLPGLDPCSAINEAGGACADRLGEAAWGPGLVLIPAEADQRFAITRQEVSWGDLAPFCRATDACPEAGPPDMPVRDVPVDLARAFAAWLTNRSGFTYRLPTHQEWLTAARGAAETRSHCAVEAGPLQRTPGPVAATAGTPGEYGLVNVLGNVQEWVIREGELQAAGGAYTDPAAACVPETLRPQDGSPDPATGFRLVREVS